jgi:hypothetical protein
MYKFVSSLDQVASKETIFKVSENCYVVNNGVEIFSCIARLDYQIKAYRNVDKMQIVFTCLNRKFVQVINVK